LFFSTQLFFLSTQFSFVQHPLLFSFVFSFEDFLKLRRKLLGLEFVVLGGKQRSIAQMGKGKSGATFCEVLIAILLPPLGVFLKYDCGVRPVPFIAVDQKLNPAHQIWEYVHL
jgi:hypothetical protein